MDSKIIFRLFFFIILLIPTHLIAIEFKVKRVVTANIRKIDELKQKLSSHDIEFYAGEEAILDTARMGADWVISAIVGFPGVPPTLESAKFSKIVAIANKESLVCAGELLLSLIHI